ncbi:hypothetical protein R2R35_14670 [Anaerocolumna sp. AGMB13020]|uniref:hypothetical protein n=1 Tax=Anaerocolumna sp. AGMB13020 TaxID=3081750 RepID=UPI002953734D|nr:hypothetical protein [Anaerocolumna sp. AGMB13020]WOO35041.1 hypothetical protein R2R35_14670 [Anaerocolumna sp. AGMB13020]
MNKKYDVETFTIDEFRELIANGDDTHHNQIRVTKSGEVFLSQDIVGAKDLEDIAFRFETFNRGNGYIGVAASKDDDIILMYNALINNWNKAVRRTYLDMWRIEQ